MDAEELGGKPKFFDGENYLFFKIVDGTPKWVIADQIEGGTIIGEVESWAHHPVDIEKVSPFSKWYLDDYGDKVEVEAKWVKSACSDYDHTLYISSSKNEAIDGFYQYRMNRLNDHTTFRNGDLYLYRISSHNRYQRWMISHDFGSDSGLAYIDNAKDLPHNTEGSWQATTSGGWQHDHALKMSRSMYSQSSWRSLMTRRQNSIADFGINTFTLRNGMSVPKVILDAQKASTAFNIKVAHKNRYRFYLVNPNQIGWMNDNTAQGRLAISALRIGMKDPEAILKTIDTARKQRGFLDCVVLDLNALSAAEIPSAWSVLEQAYADGKTMCVGSSGGDLQKAKILAGRSLPPHMMLLGDFSYSFDELTKVLEDKDIKIFFDDKLGDFVSSTTKAELEKVSKSKRTSIEIVNAAWSISHGYGSSSVFHPSAKLQDAARIYNFDFESTVPFKDEL